MLDGRGAVGGDGGVVPQGVRMVVWRELWAQAWLGLGLGLGFGFGLGLGLG